MDYKFLNYSPKFQLYQEQGSPASFFYYTGIFDQSVSSIFKTLDSGSFPSNLKGNFAFVFHNENRMVGAVDHMPTVNLFYSCRPFEIAASHICRDFNYKLGEYKNNWITQVQVKMFLGGSVGTETHNHLVKRLEAGTYFEHDKTSGEFAVKLYIDLFSHHIDNAITKGDIADIVEQIIEENTRDQFNLLWSSGTDSNCILGFIRKLKRTDNCNLISLFSNSNVTDERPTCEYLEDVYGLKANYVDLGQTVGITRGAIARARNLPKDSDYVQNLARTWDAFWWDPNIFQKYEGLLDWQFLQYPTLTGEVGDQLFGSRFGKVIISYLAQQPNATSRQIAELFVMSDAFRFIQTSVVHRQDFLNNLSNGAPAPGVNPPLPVNFRKIAWDHNGDWCSDVWNKIDTDDTINKIELLLYMHKSSHRVYNYTQLKKCTFVHPFSDYRLFHTIFKTPGHWKIHNGKTRRLSLDIIKDYVDPGPWTWPKSGIQIQMEQKQKPGLEKELCNVVRATNQ